MKQKRYEMNNLFDFMRREMEELMYDDLGFFEPFVTPKRAMLETGDKTALAEGKQYRKPVTDLEEKEHEFVVSLELPGVEKKDININVKDDMMEIKVEKTEEEKKDEKGVKTYSRRTAGFYRCLQLPGQVNEDDIKAEYKNGVLQITLPKAQIEDKQDIKRIDVK